MGTTGRGTHSIEVSVGLVEAGVLLTHPKGCVTRRMLAVANKGLLRSSDSPNDSDSGAETFQLSAIRMF